METVEFIPCPEIDCDEIAEITRRETLWSTDGPVSHIGTLCVQRHIIFMPELDAEM